MADYWKSQPRKFCQYCKCWIADNKPSVEFHERGKNHKENVAAKITEIKKKSIDKLKQEQKQDKQFQAMEEAANKAYQEDLKRMEREAAGLDSPAVTTTATPTQPPPRAKPQASKPQQRKEKFSKRPRNQSEAPVWVEGQTDDGHTYYYNAMTGESRWDKPGESSASAQPPQTESPSSCPWMEAVSPDGYTYYYNAETGESSWEKPADFPSIEASERGSKREAEGQQEEPETPQPEPLSGGEDSSSGAPVAATEEGGSEPAGQQTTVPKISFRKRKAEGEPSEKEGEDEVIDDSSPKEEKTDAEEVKKEGELQSTTAPPEEKKEDKKPPPEMSRAKKPKNPYGVWEQIQEEEDPFSKVDLQLPQVEWSTASAPANVPPEPKPKFKERVITSLGEDGGTATTFRKNKTQNGKSRRLRQRDNDDDDD